MTENQKPVVPPKPLDPEQEEDVDSFSSISQYQVYPEDDGYDKNRNPYSQV